MSDRATSVVRDFLAAWADDDPEKRAGFFSDDATWIDGAFATHTGAASIRTELLATLVIGKVQISVNVILSDGHTVMLERSDTLEIDGKIATFDVASLFEVDEDGRITRWRDYYDLQTNMDKMKSAGIPLEELSQMYEQAKAKASTRT